VEELNIKHADCPNGCVTVSIGVAAMSPERQHERNSGALIEAADAGLYSAKRRGRNCVVAHAVLLLAAAG
jgi:diguanylate cyclase (GGDEF)-like protein